MACLIAFQSRIATVDALREFRMFSPAHGLVLVALVMVAAVALWIGLRKRDTVAQRPFERGLGVGGVVIWALANGYGLWPGVFAANATLPLHVCDICALIGPIVLLRPDPPAWQRSVLYFWGIGLCTQAFITPTLKEGPAHPMFWAFWSGHFVILVFALYDVVVRRWRPAWRDWRIAIALSAAYLAVIVPVDIAFGWNYGFVGRETRADTMIEALGDWPLRVAIIFALAVVAYACLMLPWVVGRRAPRRD